MKWLTKKKSMVPSAKDHVHQNIQNTEYYRFINKNQKRVISFFFSLLSNILAESTRKLDGT